MRGDAGGCERSPLVYTPCPCSHLQAGLVWAPPGPRRLFPVDVFLLINPPPCFLATPTCSPGSWFFHSYRVKLRAALAPTLTLLPHLSPKSWKCLTSRAGCSQNRFLSHRHRGVEAGVLLGPEEGPAWCSQPWGGGGCFLFLISFFLLFLFLVYSRYLKTKRQNQISSISCQFSFQIFC